MTASRWRWMRAVATIALLLVSATTAMAQNTGSTFSATFSGLVFNRSTNTYNSVLTLTNLGATLYAPLSIVISTGTTAVTVSGTKDGKTQTLATLSCRMRQ
jgi:hypothetical protein